ncbi:DUF3817 domain-containing protein [Cocleimonas flava]|uniref:Integral membrane protein n=1 Tax=Cocleimonas flava TaxID=634765 RepID=A0A4R1EZ12_9GAMM|nr:DUF3817 domain-containing protein [Cocleimonas flava]TCJ85169.1 integral membrane protein [Cocleimonas flava]
MNKNNTKTDFTILRWAALLEGSSLLLLLFVAMPLKYYAGMAEAVRIIGPLHGVLFLSFIVLLFLHAVKRELGIINTLLGFAASFIPFGTFVFKAKALA